MIKYYPLILGIVDKLNDWNEKLNEFAANHLDNVFVGTIILGVIFAVTVLGINELNKK